MKLLIFLVVGFFGPSVLAIDDDYTKWVNDTQCENLFVGSAAFEELMVEFQHEILTASSVRFTHFQYSYIKPNNVFFATAVKTGAQLIIVELPPPLDLDDYDNRFLAFSKDPTVFRPKMFRKIESGYRRHWLENLNLKKHGDIFTLDDGRKLKVVPQSETTIPFVDHRWTIIPIL